MINFREGHGFVGADKKHLPNYVGTLALKVAKTIEYDIYALEDWETKLFGKNIFRISTPNSEFLGIRELVRFSLKHEMIYFLTSKGLERGIADFEKRGNKIDWFNIFNRESYENSLA